MSFNYGPLKATAKRLIRRFGKPGVLRKVTNTGTEDDPVLTPADTDVRVATFEEWTRDESGTLTGEKVKTVYVSTEGGSVIAKSDKLALGVLAADVDADTPFYEVTEFVELSPGSTILLYEVMVAT